MVHAHVRNMSIASVIPAGMKARLAGGDEVRVRDADESPGEGSDAGRGVLVEKAREREKDREKEKVAERSPLADLLYLRCELNHARLRVRG